MTSSEFVRQAHAKYGVEISAVNGGVKVRDLTKLPRFLQVAIAGHRHQLQKWLVNGIDEELSEIHKAEALEALGFVRLLVSQTYRGHELIEEYRLSHLDGDEVGDAVLTGLLDPDEAAADLQSRDQRSREALWSAQHPPRWIGGL